jgi:hypothetical protein
VKSWQILTRLTEQNTIAAFRDKEDVARFFLGVLPIASEEQRRPAFGWGRDDRGAASAES